jgi:cytidylate kinase
MIITISGDIGSGKSTVGKLLSSKLEYQYLSTGNIQRNIAEEMGITTLELNILSEKDPEIDRKIDSYTRALSDSEEDYIVDSRLAWHFIPTSFKVYLSCYLNVAAERISGDQQRFGEKRNEEVNVLLDKIVQRRQSEKRRFIAKYDVDYTDLSHYDFIIDTSTLKPDEVADDVIKHFNTWSLFKK